MHYVHLGEKELSLIADFENDEVAYRRAQRVTSAGDRQDHLYSVKSGWLITSIDLPDGRRQIVRVCVPGDIVGLSDIGYTCVTQDLTACNDVVLCPFPKHWLTRTLEESPRLAALMMALGAREQVITVDLLRAVGRMPAKNRVAFMLLQILSRLRVTVGRDTNEFELPLSQTDIGDAIGLTNVSVSNGLNELERTGELRRTMRKFRLNNPDRLAERVDFADRYANLDTSWFPTGKAEEVDEIVRNTSRMSSIPDVRDSRR